PIKLRRCFTATCACRKQLRVVFSPLLPNDLRDEILCPEYFVHHHPQVLNLVVVNRDQDDTILAQKLGFEMPVSSWTAAEATRIVFCKKLSGHRLISERGESVRSVRNSESWKEGVYRV